MSDAYGRDEWREDEAAAQAEALRRIEAAQASDDPGVAEVLDFSDLVALTEVPREIAGLTRLRRLFLGSTRSDGGETPWEATVFETPGPFPICRGLTELSLSRLRAEMIPLSLSGLTGLSTLDLSYTGAAALSALSSLPNLTTLTLRGSTVSDLAELSSLTGLTTLDLRDTRVSDLAALSGLTGLTTLNLSSTRVSDLAALSGLTGLTTLNLGDTRVSDLAALSGLTGLTTLDLVSTGVSDLAALSDLTGLTTLNLYDTSVSDLTVLSGLTGLTTLVLFRTGVSELAPLSGLTGLTTLNLGGTGVSDLAALSGLPSLISLDLAGTSVRDLSPLLDIPLFRDEKATHLAYKVHLPPPRKPTGAWICSRASRRIAARSRPCSISRAPIPISASLPARGAGSPRSVKDILILTSPVELTVDDARLEAKNRGEPERLAPAELGIRVDALRRHVDQLAREAAKKQVPEDIRARLASYAVPLAEDAPIYLLLDGPMSFLRGGVEDSYVTEALDGGFVEGWRQLVAMHDDLRPLLLPPLEDDPALPDLQSDFTPEDGIAVTDEVIEVMSGEEAGDSVGKSVIESLVAAKDFFEAAKGNLERRPGLLKRGVKAVGGIVALAGSAASIHAWATSPSGLAVITKLQPLLERILQFFQAAGAG